MDLTEWATIANHLGAGRHNEAIQALREYNYSGYYWLVIQKYIDDGDDNGLIYFLDEFNSTHLLTYAMNKCVLYNRQELFHRMAATFNIEDHPMLMDEVAQFARLHPTAAEWVIEILEWYDYVDESAPAPHWPPYSPYVAPPGS